MNVTDPIGDYLTHIRNAARAKHVYTDIPASKLKLAVTKILLERKYIRNYMLIKDGKQGLIRVYLQYDKDDRCVFSGMRRISRPGLRHYVNADKLPRVRNNFGIAIMSTSQGVMTNLESKRRGIGGEVLCLVW